VHVARGSITANGHALQAGDAIGLVGEPQLVLEQGSGAEVLVFDLAAVIRRLTLSASPPESSRRSSTMSKIAVVFHSGYGHTAKKWREAVADGAGR
jgi:hypothetical protein